MSYLEQVAAILLRRGVTLDVDAERAYIARCEAAGSSPHVTADVLLMHLRARKVKERLPCKRS